MLSCNWSILITFLKVNGLAFLQPSSCSNALVFETLFHIHRLSKFQDDSGTKQASSSDAKGKRPCMWSMHSWTSFRWSISCCKEKESFRAFTASFKFSWSLIWKLEACALFHRHVQGSNVLQKLQLDPYLPFPTSHPPLSVPRRFQAGKERKVNVWIGRQQERIKARGRRFCFTGNIFGYEITGI